MKKIVVLLIILFQFTQSYSQNIKMAYNSETKNTIVKKAMSNKDIKAQLKIFPKEKQAALIDRIAIFYSLEGKNKNIIKDICLSCMVSDNVINSNEAAALNTMLNSKKLEVSFLMNIIKQKNYSSLGAKELLTTVATIFLDGAKSGTVTGGAIHNTPTSRGKIGKALGAILGGAVGAWFGGPVGLGGGAFIGAAIGDALGDAVSGTTSNVVANPDGSGCTKPYFPLN